MGNIKPKLEESAAFIKSKVDFDWSATTFVMLGSGFKGIVENLSPLHSIPQSDVPHLKSPNVEGHGKDLLFCELNGKPVVFQTGRIHSYEGHQPADLVYSTRLAATLGIPTGVFTNASGSTRKEIIPGSLVVIEDHINMMGFNVLVGENGELGKKFVDMYHCYNPTVVAALTKEFNLKSGVYAGLSGPTYETSAETRMMGLLGADLVGMSTVQEVIAARQMGMNVVGISLATNYAAGIAEEVDHDEVLEIGRLATPRIKEMLPKVLETIHKSI